MTSVRERVLHVARAQLREAASEALDALEARVLRGQTAGRGRSIERVREVLERDRALVSATRPDPVAPSAPPPPSPRPPAVQPVPACDEPIRTRSMAKLLAAQGHPERALAIYTYLLARDGSDPALEAEVAALRAAQLRADPPEG